MQQTNVLPLAKVARGSHATDLTESAKLFLNITSEDRRNFLFLPWAGGAFCCFCVAPLCFRRDTTILV